MNYILFQVVVALKAQQVEDLYHCQPDLINQEKIKVLLDARKVGDGGIGIHITNLIHGLIGSNLVDLTVIVDPKKAHLLPQSDQYNLIYDQASPYSVDEFFKMPKRIDFKNFDLFHVPHYTLPFNIPIPTVITIHDLIHITHPEKFYYPFIARFLINSASARAAKIITVSNASKLELQKFNPGIASKISVIPNALNPDLTINSSLSLETAKRYGIASAKYLIAMFSNLKPHKGAGDLLVAFSKIRHKYPDTKLVIVGQGATDVKYLTSILNRGTDLKNVLFTGSVSTSDLAELYAGAQFLIVSSLTEGFCIPVIEAKAQGVRVVARPVAAVRELLDTNDIVCRDFSVHALTESLEMALSQSRQDPYPTQNKFNPEDYSCKSTAAKTLEVYREVVKKNDVDNVASKESANLYGGIK